jgi:hypothetical protein
MAQNQHPSNNDALQSLNDTNLILGDSEFSSAGGFTEPISVGLSMATSR